MQIDAIKQLVSSDFQAMDELISQHLGTDVKLIKQLGQHIVKGGGKRLRPLLVLISAKAFNYTGERHIELAALIEFIHTATLLHDDVVDQSEMRRGNETANAIWGNEASVLVGDFLFSRAFQMLVNVGNIKIMDVIAKATNTITEGEVLQLMNRHNCATDEAFYMQVIQAKTAELFSAATHSGAILSDQSAEITQAMADYGNNLGIAFQLIDDVLDYTGDAEEMGKNLGDDLAEGKPTLPLIYALEKADPEQQAMINSAITHGHLDRLSEIKQAIISLGAIEYTLDSAKQHVQASLDALHKIPKSEYRDAMEQIAEFALQRSF